MSELISVAEAARELGRDPSRVRALVASGELSGMRIGRNWAVYRTAVARRKRERPGSGRPFEPRNAWAVLFLASERQVGWLDAGSLWRIRNVLSLNGLTALAPRLRRRAAIHHFRCHPGELRYLIEDPALVLSDISAAGAHGLGLVAGSEADGYVKASELAGLRRRHALEPAAERAEANAVVRAVANGAWPFEDGEKLAPLSVVALDLAEDADPRSIRIGAETLKSLDRQLRRRPK